MISLILVDADGVAIRPQEYFSLRYARERSIDPAIVTAFFKEKFPLCTTGKADLKLELEPYLASWGWPGSVEGLLSYWFEGERTRDEAVLARLQTWRKGGIPCYLAADQEKYRADYLWNQVGLKNDFDGSFFSCEVGFEKKSPQYFQYISKKMGGPFAEILFFDDVEGNVANAQSVGVDGRLVKQLSDFQM